MGGKDDPVNEKGIGYYNDLVSNPLSSCSFGSCLLRFAFVFFPLNYGSHLLTLPPDPPCL
jgi:hypothetical protein